LDLKQEISYLERERGEGERDTEKKRERKRDIQRKIDNKNHRKRSVAQLVINNYRSFFYCGT
jgi:hypothetical protein